MNNRSVPFSSAFILGLLIAAGLVVGGSFIGDGFFRAHMVERLVTVRGVAQRPVKADLAVWTLSYAASGDNLSALNSKLNDDADAVRQFLKAQGFTDPESQPLPIRLVDSEAGGIGRATGGRYRLSGGFRIRSTNVQRVHDALQHTGDLIEQGVVLSAEMAAAEPNPAYYFTQLDSQRPALLAEAVKNAHAAAEQLVSDSGKLGPIRQATAESLEIFAREAPDGRANELSHIDKTVRMIAVFQYSVE